MALGATTAAILLPLLPIGRWFGFAPPPAVYFLYVVGATATYLAVVEIIKGVFYPKAPIGTVGVEQGKCLNPVSDRKAH